jgi:hypothetical protein
MCPKAYSGNNSSGEKKSELAGYRMVLSTKMEIIGANDHLQARPVFFSPQLKNNQREQALAVRPTQRLPFQQY